MAAGLASTGQATAAAPKGEKAKPSVSRSQLTPSSQTNTAKPRGVMPKSGTHAFLLKLGAKSTHDVFEANAAKGKAEAKSAAKEQLGEVRASQNAVTSKLPQGTKVLYRTHAAMNAIAVRTDAKNLKSLRAIPGVKAVYPIASKRPSNSYAAPLVGAPAGWQATGNRGGGRSIAIIDTGLDYTHANFGGPGTEAAYETAQATEDQPADPALFPSTKIVGGYDFTGDDYNADSDDPAQTVAAPDPNPLDCNGHGSHVGGTAAGYGENADGTTYAGPYDNTTPFGSMKIGPGIAPLASLYAYRVFGCDGSSDVVGLAMDRAADPNNDGDTSDAVDVINMSLGADFGSSLDGDAQLANDLAAMGIQVVVASGNGGDLYDVGGSPGNAPRTLTVANSIDASSVIDALTVASPAGIAGSNYGATRSVAYDWANDPDLAGPLAAIATVSNKDGCDPLAPSDAALVVGKVAFLEWTDDDTVRRCGSVARSGNVAAAGAIGFVFADDAETFAAGITGSAVIPGVMVTKSAGDTLRANLGAPVVVSGTIANGFTQLFPADNDKLNAGSSRNARNPGGVKPDVAGVGTSVFSTAVGTGDEGMSIGGTSMATPQVAGLAAIVIGQHPTWSVEEVKADIMNTSGQDLFTGDNHTGDIYAPNRVGAGRIQVQPALANTVVAYAEDDDGAVSVSFGPLEVTEPTVLTKSVVVANKGGTSATYDIAYDAITEIPGADYSVTPAQVTVAAGATQTFDVTLTIDPTELTKTRDATLDALQGDLPRDFIADASGRVTLTSAGRPTLRVPVYSAPRPASTVTQADTLAMQGEETQTGQVEFTGDRVDQGAGAESVFSLLAGFQLQARSDEAPECSEEIDELCVNNVDERSADLKYVGTAVNQFGDDPIADGYAYFGINVQGPWHTPANMQEFDIFLDTDGDGQDDYVMFNTRLGETDVMVSQTLSMEDFSTVDVQLINDRFGNIDTALFDSDSLVMPVNLAAIGITEESSRISYDIVTFSNQQDGPVDFVEDLSFDALNPGIVIEDASSLLWADDGVPLLVTRNRDAYLADGSLGLMLMHFHNVNGSKTEVVQLQPATVGLEVDPASVTVGQQVTATVTVANTEGTAPTGNVTLKTSGGATLGAPTPLEDDGTAQITFTPTVPGTITLHAEYAGDGTYDAASSGDKTVTVVAAVGNVTLNLVPTTVGAGASVTGTVTVANTAGVVPTGTVTLKNNKGTTLGSGPLDATGKAAITFAAVPAGVYTVAATYSGDANYSGGTSANTSLTVTKNASVVTLKLNKEKVQKGKKVKATVTVATVNGLVPTDDVSLRAGKKGKTWLGTKELVNGKAVFKIKFPKTGKVKLFAKYLGDDNFTAGQSKKVKLKVV